MERPIKDENGLWTTCIKLAKRYRRELEQRSGYWKRRHWDYPTQIKARQRRKHRAL